MQAGCGKTKRFYAKTTRLEQDGAPKSERLRQFLSSRLRA
jgi:hypothetical protein